MNLDDAEDRDVAAGEYVMGTLAGADRVAFEAALASDLDLQAAVYAWQDRLLDLARRAPPSTPDAALWERIERAVDVRQRDAAAPTAPPARVATEAGNDPVWSRMSTWRLTTALATAAALVLAVLLAVRGPLGDDTYGERYLAVLRSPTDRDAGWVVEATRGGDVRLVPVATLAPPPAGKSLQFWTKPDGASGPTSLGLVRPGEVAVIPATRLPALGEKQLFEVTLEPEKGSPIGRPTGPVLYVGSTVHL